MALFQWSKSSSERASGRGPAGVELNATRVLATEAGSARGKLIPLEEPRSELRLVISMEKKTPVLGQGALGVVRKAPHVICDRYLPELGQPKSWKNGRHNLTADSALGLVFDHIAKPLSVFEGSWFVLPNYLSLSQVQRFNVLAEKSKIRLNGTATLPLALAAERAASFLAAPSSSSGNLSQGMPGYVVIVDVDEHALMFNTIRIDEAEVRSINSVSIPHLGWRLWNNKLLDAISDRCVRACRRDPRDSADAEQDLFEQIEPCLERARAGQRAEIIVRAAHWYQDLILTQADLDAFCSSLCAAAIVEARPFLAGPNDAGIPRAIWLTAAAGLLPGFALALHKNSSDRTAVRVLHSEAGAHAACYLATRAAAGELPKTHLDTAIPLPPRVDPRLLSRPNPSVSSSTSKG